MTGPEQRPQRMSPEAFQQRVRRLSVPPPDGQWGTIRLQVGDRVDEGSVPFTDDEIPGLVAGCEAFDLIRRTGWRTSGMQREFLMAGGTSFPYSITHDNISLLQDRRVAVSGILQAAELAGESLDRYGVDDYQPASYETEADVQRAEDMGRAFETLRDLPDRLIAHPPQTTT